MGDSETVKVVVRKSDLAPGLKTIDLKSLREVLAKAQNKQQSSSKLDNVASKKPTKEPVVLRQFRSSEKILLNNEPGAFKINLLDPSASLTCYLATHK